MVNVLNKPLPFKGKIPSVVTDDYQQVMKALAGSKALLDLLIIIRDYLWNFTLKR